MPKINLDRYAGSSTSMIQRVTVDEVDLINWQGLPIKSLPRQVVCETGRILGEQRGFAHAKVEGSTHTMTAAECRALAASLLVAADVLEGKQEAAELTRNREERQASEARAAAERNERERRLTEEGVDIVCVGCGTTKRVLPEDYADWLKQKPFCCRRQNRAYRLIGDSTPHPTH